METIPKFTRDCEIIHLGMNPMNGGIPAMEAKISMIFNEFSFLLTHWLRDVMFLCLNRVINRMVMAEYTAKNNILSFRE